MPYKDPDRQKAYFHERYLGKRLEKQSYDRIYRTKNAQQMQINRQNHRKRHPLYTTWSSMRSRCYSLGHHAYVSYGGRGIVLCDRWIEPNGQGFHNFAADMGERPEGMTVDRIDNDGPYSPENCRWATRSQQQKNKRKADTLQQRIAELEVENQQLKHRLSLAEIHERHQAAKTNRPAT